MVVACIGEDWGGEVKIYKGNGMHYSLLVIALTDGRPSGASTDLCARIFYLLFLSSTILSNRS